MWRINEQSGRSPGTASGVCFCCRFAQVDSRVYERIAALGFLVALIAVRVKMRETRLPRVDARILWNAGQQTYWGGAHDAAFTVCVVDDVCFCRADRWYFDYSGCLPSFRMSWNSPAKAALRRCIRGIRGRSLVCDV